MNLNTDYYTRKQKEKDFLSFYSVLPSAALRGKDLKSRTKNGGYVARPKTNAVDADDEISNVESNN